MQKAKGKVLVVGGGVAGIQASLDLADLGYYVYLVEKRASIGGVMAKLDKTFPTNDCSLCILAPKMAEAGRSPNIEILTLTEVINVEGEPGNFKVKLKINPRYVDLEKCTACGDCRSVCPRLSIDKYNANLTFTRAIRIDFPQAVPTAYYIDKETCLNLNYEACTLCINICGPKAIDFSQQPEIKEIEVGTILLAPGFGPVPQSALKKYGYGKYEDVMTSIEMERLMCVSGPTQGHIIRPSDFKPPKRIAYIQCVGSRDITCNRLYCSCVCCMYAVKQASVIKEHEPDAEFTFFYIDIRTQNKGFDAAFKNIVDKYGFRIIKAKPGEVKKMGDKLALSYIDESGEIKRELFDMIVLSVGLSPPEDAENISKVFGIKLNEFGFAKTSYFNPIETSKPGIYVIGAFQGPKDIPESVMQASAGAASASEILKEGRFSSYVVKEYPPENEELMSGEPRIGVFVCHCGINIAGVINVKEVVEYAGTLPKVVHAEDIVYTCSQDSLEHIKKKIKELKLNRVIVAACTPRTHEPLFQSTLREAGLNPALFEMANIRDHCSWVHYDNPKKATEKAKDLVRMAVFKSQKLIPLESQQVKVIPSALVIGGGVGGLTAALSVAEQGYQVYLVEKEKELGGNLRKIKFLITGENPKEFLNELINKVEKHEKIKIYKEAQIEEITGFIGNFTTTIKTQNGILEKVEHGVIIIATGGKEYRPSKYPLDGEKVITQLEFEEKLFKGLDKEVKRIVMIQCAGSRGEELTYCSKICCIEALKNALKIKEINPSIDVYILYQDLRAYGFYEKYYLTAREKGVKFIRFPSDKRPKVIKNENEVSVRTYDTILKEEIEIPCDLVVLSVGIVSTQEKEIFNMLKLTQDADGFIMEAHVKLRPVDTYTDGVYICGLAHGPKPLNEVIAQAKAAAGRACIPLAKGSAEIPPIAASVDEKKCIGCGICVSLCPFGAIELIKVDKRRKAQVIKAACKGCGACAARCPVFAIDTGGFSSPAILEQIEGFKKIEEKIEEKKEKTAK